MVFNFVGPSVVGEVHSLMATLIMLQLLCVNFPNQYQLEFMPSKVVVTSVPSEYKEAMERAVNFVNKLICRYPFLPKRLELGSDWVVAIDAMFEQVLNPET